MTTMKKVSNDNTEFILKLMIQLKNEENDRVKIIDSKTTTLIGIITVMLTIFSDICISDKILEILTITNLCNNIFLSITFSSYLIFSIVSLLLLIWSYSIKKFIDTPKPSTLLKYYLTNEPKNNIQTNIIQDMAIMLDYNNSLIKDKIKKYKIGVYLLLAATLSLILFIICLLWM